MLQKEQLKIGLRFDLASKRGHYFRLGNFARPMKVGEDHLAQWSDLGVRYIPCPLSEATHVHGWESYACFPTIERLLQEGNPR